jgi:hypothetical protein
MKTNCCNTRHIHVIDKRRICVNPGCDHYLEITETHLELKGLKYFLVGGVFIFTILFTFDDFSKPGESDNPGNNSILRPQSEPLTLENLKAELAKQQVLCADEVLAQIRLETGNLSSVLLKRTNNLMGMRYPFKRKTSAIGIYLPGPDTIVNGTSKELMKYAKTNHYAAYETWQDAVADYKLWQDTQFRMQERYLDFLGKVYAEDSLYVNKIRKMTYREKVIKANSADAVALN